MGLVQLPLMFRILTPHASLNRSDIGAAYDVAIAGRYTSVADGNGGLQVINIADPSSPSIVGSVDPLAEHQKDKGQDARPSHCGCPPTTESPCTITLPIPSPPGSGEWES